MRNGHYIRTYTGIQFFPTDPNPADIRIVDIAHALANICRFTGHCRRFYSVAEHSINVSRTVSPSNALVALLHDATEAYLNDIARPIKVQLPEYQVWEKELWGHIARKFNVPVTIPQEVKEQDDWWLIQEGHHLLSAEEWPQSAISSRNLDLMPPGVAFRDFLDIYERLSNGLHGN